MVYLYLCFVNFGIPFLIWNARLLPFIDLPFRLAAAEIYKGYNDFSNSFADFFALDLFPKPNIVHVLFCSLKVFSSLEIANKVFYSIYIVLFPLSILLVIRKVKGHPWFSLLSFPLIFNYSETWGFAEFSMALPICILFFYFLLDYFDTPRRRSRIMVGFLLMNLFFVHCLAALFALFIFSICCLYLYRRSLRRLFIEWAVALPLLMMTIAWWLHDPLQYRFQDAKWTYLFNYYFYKWLPHSLLQRGNLLFYDNFSLFKGSPGKFAALFFSFAIILPLVYGWIRYRRVFFSNQSRYSRQMRFSLLMFLIASLFFYIFIPHKLYGNYYLFPRFSVYILLSFLFLCSVVPWRRFCHLSRIVLGTVCLLHLAVWADYFRDFNRENRSFSRQIMPRDSKNKVLAGLIYHYRFRGRPIYIHFPNYHIVWNDGIASTCVMDFNFGIIRRKAGESLLPSNLKMEWVGRHRQYAGHFSGADYILVKGRIPPPHRQYFKDFHLIKTISDWSLYEKA